MAWFQQLISTVERHALHKKYSEIPIAFAENDHILASAEVVEKFPFPSFDVPKESRP
jgi:hypothetical protein